MTGARFPVTRARRLAMRSTPLIAALAAAFFAAPSCLAQGSASPFTSGIRYDNDRRVTGTIAPDPDGAGPLHHAAVRNSYDPAGRLVLTEKGELESWQSEAVAPSEWAGFTIFEAAAFAYDPMGRELLEVHSSGGAVFTVTQTSYDGMGRKDCVAVRMNPALYPNAVAAGGGLPASACTLGSPGSSGPDRITHFTYHVNGQVLKEQRAWNVTVANGFPATLQQDYATYDYTPNGKLANVTDANGNKAELRYDGFDRQNCWIFPSKTTAGALGGDCSTGDFEAYGYDPAGNRTSLRKRDGVTLTYQYDALNRLTQKTVPASASNAPGYSVFYGYDLRGLQTYARFGSDSGQGVTNSYDGAGRLASSATDMDGTARTLTAQYDADGNRFALNGDTSAWGYTAAFSFDGVDRLSGIVETGHPVVQIDYDAAGRRSSLGLGFDTFPSSASYVYEPVGRLHRLTHHLAGNGNDEVLEFGYNPANQVVTRTSSNDAYASNTALSVNRTYAVNGLNQYTGTVSGGTPSASFNYDLNGNLISDGSNNYVYDAENRLVSASGGHTATLSYDPLGRLWQLSSPTTITRFLYDGDRRAIEYDPGSGSGAGSATLLRAYAHGAGPDEPLVWYEAVPGGVSRRYLHADHQGSIIAVADQSGNPIAVNAYDEWGIPNGSNLGRFGYTGQAWLPELGMWYYKARIYSPTLGRFLQTDPIGYEDQVNLYAYVGNDPVDKADPTGLGPATVARWGYRIYRFNGSIRMASRETFKEVALDWHALDTDAHTSTGEKVKAAIDLILGTNLHNSVFPDKSGDKIHGDLPSADEVGEGERADAIEELGKSIDQRIGEMRAATQRHLRDGGSPHDPDYQRNKKGHETRIRLEQALKDELERRQISKR